MALVNVLLLTLSLCKVIFAVVIKYTLQCVVAEKIVLNTRSSKMYVNWRPFSQSWWRSEAGHCWCCRTCR